MKNTIIYILILFLGACTEPYYQETPDYEEMLIIYGRITDQDEKYTVELTRAMGLYDENVSDEELYETGAVVMITDNSGNTETLVEEEPGTYRTSGNNIIGTYGESYTLRIITDDGEEYESEPVSLIIGPELDTVYTEYNELYSFESQEYVKGFGVKINTGQFPEKSKNYYLKWEYEEIWQLTPYWNTQYFDHDHCWITEQSNNILIFNTEDIDNNQLNDISILNINENNYRLYEGYSVLIRQYVIGESEYEFWRIMKQNIMDNGGIMDNVPYNPVGNISCTSNPEKKVLGFFSAASVSGKRTFFPNPMYEIEFPTFNERCKSTRVSLRYYNYLKEKQTLYVVHFDELLEEVVFTRQRYCVDCSVIENSKVVEPDYWNYKIY